MEWVVQGAEGLSGRKGGPCATGDSCGKSLGVGGPSCPVPLTSDSIPSFLHTLQGQADPALPTLPAPAKVETAGVGDLAGLGL